MDRTRQYGNREATKQTAVTTRQLPSDTYHEIEIGAPGSTKQLLNHHDAQQTNSRSNRRQAECLLKNDGSNLRSRAPIALSAPKSASRSSTDAYKVCATMIKPTTSPSDVAAPKLMPKPVRFNQYLMEIAAYSCCVLASSSGNRSLIRSADNLWIRPILNLNEEVGRDIGIAIQKLGRTIDCGEDVRRN